MVSQKNIWQRLDARHVAYICAGIAFFILVFGFLSRVDVLNWIDPVDRFINDFYANTTSELLSIALTVLVIDAFNQRRATAQEKRRLILQMGSDDNTLAKEAVRLMRLEGWLESGILRGASLAEANLRGAILIGADLIRARMPLVNLSVASLSGVSLQEANLSGANLEFASLEGTNLYGANLQVANLYRAYLWKANLQRVSLVKANLYGANLRKVDLRGANLQGAKLKQAKFGKGTILPDGSTWTPDTDMARFTDPDHPGFWRSDNPISPAYQGGI